VRPMSRLLLAALATGLLSGLLPILLMEKAYGRSIDDVGGAPFEVTEGRPSSSGRGTGFKPEVGRKAAEKYMAPRQGWSQNQQGETPVQSVQPELSGRRSPALSQNSHYLALHLGTFVSDTAYKWGQNFSEGSGRWNFGVTYRVGEWVNSMDLAIRIDISEYALLEGRASKMSFLPVVTFPDASSRFPLYFGAGLGIGVFIHQINQESPLSIDYQLIAGARFFEVFENTGFFVEGGIKNHLFLLSDGQYNGTFVAAGTVFTF
jgi:hypothetical protein